MSAAPLPGGYAVTVSADHSHVLVNAKGRALQNVPPKLRKTPEWQQIVALRGSYEARLDRNRRVVAGWMLTATPVPVGIVGQLLDDTAWATPLTGLLAQGGIGSGFVTGAAAGGVTLSDAGTAASGDLVFLHPASTPALDTWRSRAVALGIRQGTQQLARPVITPGADEGSVRACKRFSERTIASAVRASYAFNALGWRTAGGTARRDVTLHGAEAAFTVAFEYFHDGEFYGDWNQECQTGSLRFELGNGAVRLREVPPALFSEACLDISRVLNQTGRA